MGVKQKKRTETNPNKKSKNREKRIRRAVAWEQLAELLSCYRVETFDDTRLVRTAIAKADELIAKLREGGSIEMPKTKKKAVKKPAKSKPVQPFVY